MRTTGAAYGLSDCVEPTNTLFLVMEKYPGGVCVQLPPVTKLSPPPSWSVMAPFMNTNHSGRSHTAPKSAPARLNDVVKRSITVVTQ